MGFSVLAGRVRGDEAGVGLAGWVAKEIATGGGEIDEEGRLRRLLRRVGLFLLAALRSPFRRRLYDHLDDHEAARPVARLPRVHKIVHVAESGRRRRHADFQPLLDEDRAHLVERPLISAILVVLRQQDDLADVRWPS